MLIGRGGFFVKTARIPVIAKPLLAMISLLSLLFCVCSAEAVDTLDQQLLHAAKSGDLGQVKTALARGPTSTLRIWAARRR